MSPVKFLKGVKEAAMFVFATCSSVATIPVNLKCVKKLGVSDEIANFVIPFGAVMNMNGTAIYEAVAVIFTAQVLSLIHIFSAEIVEVGENDYGLKKGMIVTCNPYFNCTHCYSCRRGLVNCCTTNQTMGCQRDGAFSEYVAMPLERIYDGKGVPPKTLALIEPFCISYHGVSRANIKPGDRVLVLGAGTIGAVSYTHLDVYKRQA